MIRSIWIDRKTAAGHGRKNRISGKKAAHMTEYAILGLLSFAFYRGILKKEKRQFLAALLTAAVYAATDEFHQYFIPGRSAEVMDVCIDTLGASIGLAILFFTLKVVRKQLPKIKAYFTIKITDR